MYWLKPFDAVNDTANAMALLRFDWSRKPVLEIGGGDGVFSFIMHGGRFRFLDDRYAQADVNKSGDIYDVYKIEERLTISAVPSLGYDVGVDLKLSHLQKSKETRMYRHLISSLPETLPLKKNIFGTVFLYTFHGLTDYEKSLREIRRVMRTDGNLLMIAVNSAVKENFACFNMHDYFQKIGFKELSHYFLALDGGRHAEIGGIFSKSLSEWKDLLRRSDFQIEEAYTQVSPFLWRIYDTQTRPFLKFLIRLNHRSKVLHLKGIFKVIWMCVWLPIIFLFYWFCARPAKAACDTEVQTVFLGIRARPL